MTRPKALLSWSSGKDSAYALAEARRAGEVEIVGLLTTVTTTYDRVAMHGVRRELLARGLRAKLACVDPRQLDRAFAGRTFDDALLAELPAQVDPCGERGEFHTFATHGPMFTAPIEVAVGEIVEREGFVFADLL